MPECNPVSPIDTFVAIGDSFTEGLEDQAPGGGLRGWADMVAAALAGQRPRLRHAHLAIPAKPRARRPAPPLPAPPPPPPPPRVPSFGRPAHLRRPGHPARRRLGAPAFRPG